MSDQKTLKDLLNEIKVKSEDVADKAGSLQKTGYFVKEFAEVSIENFDRSPLADYPGNFIHGFQSVLKDLGKIGHHMNSMPSLASGLTFGTASVMTALSGISTAYTYRSNPSYAPFYSQYDEVVDRGQTKDQAISAIKRLKLNSVKEGLEAISLLESAWDVHAQGVGISTSSLIPLREAIAKTLQAIQKKSPQSKLNKWILELGGKVAFAYITTTDLQKLQDEHEILRDKLSGSKSGNYSREDEKRLLRDGSLHLLKILSIVDINKLK